MMTSMQEPLRFERIFLEKVWGGRALAADPGAGGLGLELPPGLQVGETWELVDRADVNSVVAMGSFRGARLEELMATHREALLGDVPATPEGRFPLLVKYIDAAAHLSVQVHPDEAQAATEAAWEAKAEAWVILGATKGGLIYHGFAPGVTRASFGAAVRSGGPLAKSLRSFRPVPGECYFVPGGTVHAIGAGVTLIEVQQNSDTTFRVDDWGRVGLDGKPREVHVEEALQCLDFEPAPTPVTAPESCPRSLELATCSAFSMGLVDVAGSLEGDTQGLAPRVLAAVRGAGRLVSAAGEFPLGLGDVCLLPAALGTYTIHSVGSAPLRLIEMSPKATPSPA